MPDANNPLVIIVASFTGVSVTVIASAVGGYVQGQNQLKLQHEQFAENRGTASVAVETARQNERYERIRVAFAALLEALHRFCALPHERSDPREPGKRMRIANELQASLARARAIAVVDLLPRGSLEELRKALAQDGTYEEQAKAIDEAGLISRMETEIAQSLFAFSPDSAPLPERSHPTRPRRHWWRWWQ